MITNRGGRIPFQDTTTCHLERDMQRLNSTMLSLHSCGFYYGALSSQDAQERLRDKDVGTFLLRDSTNNGYLFALSVNTRHGPTSVRIEYTDSKFRLDADASLQMPRFDCVLQLVQFYVSLSQFDAKGDFVWSDNSGKRRDAPVRLKWPLLKNTHSLQHLCRKTINMTRIQQQKQLSSAISLNHRSSHLIPQQQQTQTKPSQDVTSLPKILQTFLEDYPYVI